MARYDTSFDQGFGTLGGSGGGGDEGEEKGGPETRPGEGRARWSVLERAERRWVPWYEWCMSTHEVERADRAEPPSHAGSTPSVAGD